MRKLTQIVITLAALGFIAATALADSVKCPTVKGEPNVYAIGSSTMGSVLGPMLKRKLKAEGVKFERWGKASTGLARPDFHDWPKRAPGLMRSHKPDIVIVSLGTNDFQSIWHKKKWIKWGTDRWETIYATRVDRMLESLAGKDQRRMVLWTGPTAFSGRKAEKRAPVVNRIMKERVAAAAKAGTNVVFVDAYARTSDAKGNALSYATIDGKRQKIRTSDNIHLTTEAVDGLMAEPIMAHIRPCFPRTEAEAKPEPDQSDDDEGNADEAGGHEKVGDEGQASDDPDDDDDAEDGKTEVVKDTAAMPAGG